MYTQVLLFKKSNISSILQNICLRQGKKLVFLLKRLRRAEMEWLGWGGNREKMTAFLRSLVCAYFHRLFVVSLQFRHAAELKPIGNALLGFDEHREAKPRSHRDKGFASIRGIPFRTQIQDVAPKPRCSFCLPSVRRCQIAFRSQTTR